MSLLRDKLKAIAQKRSEAGPVQGQVQQTRPVCAQIETEFTLAPLQLCREGLELLCAGGEFSGPYRGPEGLAFVDVESTGLSRGAGTVAFEIGVGRIRGDTMCITQLWMRDYDEEEDMLSRLPALLDGATALVSFNGKSFDIPMLESRMVMNRLSPRCLHIDQIDLLHPARRMYKLRLSSCTLTNLEERVLGHVRRDDIPGSEIPGLWRQFLQDKNEEPLKKVFEHNARDVYSMALLLQALHDGHVSPLTLAEPKDVYSVGRVLEKAGRVELAESCYLYVDAGALKGLSGQALNRMYRRQGRGQEQLSLLEKMASDGAVSAFAHVELAKLYEHRLGDQQKALFHTEQAMLACTDEFEMQALRKRRTRLKDRLNRLAEKQKTDSEGK